VVEAVTFHPSILQRQGDPWQESANEIEASPDLNTEHKT
jgi:hypothetical protein